MSFLDFLKKSKMESLRDIPPPPPKEEMPGFPVLKEKKKPEIVELSKEAAVKKEKAGIKERETHKAYKPIFMKINAYKAMMDMIGHVKDKLQEGEDTLKRLSDFKADEDRNFKNWKRYIKDIQNKLIFVDEVIFKKSSR